MIRRRLRFRLVLYVLAAEVVLLAGLFTFSDRRPQEQQAAPAEGKTYADLVAANYRILSGAETTRLLDFATNLHRCMSRRGVELREPAPQKTKIELGVPSGTDRKELERVALACGESLGGPPPGASLQAVQRTGSAVVVYLPDRCLLDEKTLRRTGQLSR